MRDDHEKPLSDMPEMTCGRCGRTFPVEADLNQVACPHCAVVLEVPADVTHSAVLEPVEDRVTEAGTSSVFDSAALRSGDASIPVPSSIKAPDFSRWGKSDSSAIRSDDLKTKPTASHVPGAFHAGEHAEPALAASQKHKEFPLKSVTPITPGRVEDSVETSPRPAASTLHAPTGGVSRKTFLALMIYASAITAVCLGLAFFLLMHRQHQLESLPDVVPPANDDGTLTRVLVPADAELPAGHVLALGHPQRFGDLRVTPIEVIREPLEFVHFRGDETREPAGEVLKLRLRFENVSETGKAFVPLDEDLLFYRTFDNRSGNRLKANNFVAASKQDVDSLIPIFDHPIGSDWDLADQNLGTTLLPGEAVETYIPTEVDPPETTGELTWRIHLRKGIAPNGWGVTTLIEVATAGGK